MAPDTTLPPVLEAFAARACARAPAHRRVRLEQRGEMRLSPGGRWLTFTATQWMETQEVAFCWRARVRMAPLVTAVVEDAFEHGRGRLDAKVWGVLRVAHAEGPDADRGEAQRYLAELPWNPRALMANGALTFRATASDAVRVWAGSPETHVELHLDAGGDVVRAAASNRPRGDEGPAAWEGRFHDYRDLGGLRVPSGGEVARLLPEGRFAYWRGEITALAVD